MATTLSPHLCVHDGKAAVEFYKAAFGATTGRVMPAEDGRRLMHADLIIGDVRFYLCDEFPEHKAGGHNDASPKTLGGTTVTMHLEVPDCDAACGQAAAAGATVTMPPWDAFWGDRYARVVDPFGHAWSFSHPLKQC